ncbi:hypothetical protein FRB94_012748 [Tulasnella sp. JGI-2019a]|nr:hypothetical protein FRB94_012748 [Tulasnella sp. JGI-2019a]
MSGVVINQTEVPDQEVAEGAHAAYRSSPLLSKHPEPNNGGYGISDDETRMHPSGKAIPLLAEGESVGSPDEGGFSATVGTRTEVQRSGPNGNANDKKRLQHDSRTPPIHEAAASTGRILRVVKRASKVKFHPLRALQHLEAYIHAHLGNASSRRFDRSGDVRDLDKSIRHHREALRRRSIGHPGRPITLEELGTALSKRFDRRGYMSDLEGSVHHLQEALSLRPIGHPSRSETLKNLGITLIKRFDRTRNTADLEESIYHLQIALPLHSIGHPSRPVTLENLGDALRIRFNRIGNTCDLDESIRHFEETLPLYPIGHPRRPVILNVIGSVLSSRFDLTGNMDDLEESIHHLKEALPLHPIGRSSRSLTLNTLGNALGDRFDRTGNIADLEEAIRYLRENLFLSSTSTLSRPGILNNLGISLSTRFDQTGNMADLEESIRFHQEALSLCPVGHPGRSNTLNSLGMTISKRSHQTGNLADLEESIRHHQEALSLCPIGHPGRTVALNSLGSRLMTQFDRTGNMADLEDSICYNQEALSLRPIGHPARPATLTNLGNRLSTRFDRMGNMADLEGSIRCHREALSLCPIGHASRLATLNNLGIALGTRFERTGNMDDLKESARHHREALSLCPIGHPGRPKTLKNLGMTISRLFSRTDNAANLKESIQLHQEALSLCPIGHPGHSEALTDLGNRLITRFGRTGNMADLEDSICHHQEALSLCSIGHPRRSTALNNLGVALGIRFEQKGIIADLQESIHYHMDAAGYPHSLLSTRLHSAHNWIISARQNNSKSLEKAYTAYMDLLDRSLLLSASSIHDTHSHIVQINREGTAVTKDATSHAIEKFRLHKAVEIAERGRALLFTQLGNYRRPLDDLEVLNKKLADRLRTLSTALEQSFTQSFQDVATGLSTTEDRIARSQKIAVEWNHTVEEIRQLKGFESFLGTTPFSTLQKAAADGPVILVNISDYGSFAVIVTVTGDPLPVPLPDATPFAVKALAKRLIKSTTGGLNESKSNQNLTEILRDMWVMIVSPIVLQLERTTRLSAGSRVWWMPTSAAWWLPLHAAGPYKSGERNLSDRFISSYTPTLSSLVRSRAGYQPTQNTRGPRMLAVAQAEAEGQITLSNVKAEVTLIRQLQAQVTVIEGEACTRDNVLARLKDTAWVHFSCHGHQHPTEPFKSHFSVGTLDAPLTVLDIIRNGLPQAELAVLSACHSAAGEKTTPDEAINLAAGTVFAGFRSVVGTMWAMDDRDGPVMAQEFYKYMFRNGPGAVDCRDAAKALVMGVRELRRRKVPLERWINFVHYV